MMETPGTSEMSVNFYQNSQRNIPEDIFIWIQLGQFRAQSQFNMDSVNLLTSRATLSFSVTSIRESVTDSADTNPGTLALSSSKHFCPWHNDWGETIMLF
jgi:hypothetical protein